MSSSQLPILQMAFTEAGGHWSTFLIWAKNTFTLGRSDYQRQYEPILYGWRQGGQHYWCGDRDPARAVLRVHSSLGFSGFFAVPHAARRVPYLWRGGRGGSLERWETSVNQSTHVLPGVLGPQTLLVTDPGAVSHSW